MRVKNSIEVFSLTKKFNEFIAVKNISFEVRKGEIFGLLGPNGAGKTTTIRMLTGILKPDTGNALIEGNDITVKPLEAKQVMGIVPEMANAYNDLSAIKNLLLMGELYGLDKKKRGEKAEKLLKMLKLYEKRNNKVKTFSKGLKQRVIIGMALMNEAKILVLDEPTSGLDVESTRLIRGLIKEYNQRGITILITTHNMGEADQLCDRIAVMNKGKIIAIQRPEKLKQLAKKEICIEVAFEKRIKNNFQFENTRVEKTGDKIRIFTENPELIIPKIVKFSEFNKNKIISINTLKPSLEEVFVSLTGEKNEVKSV